MADGEKSPEPVAPWRYKTGIAMFVIGNTMVPLSPVFLGLGMPARFVPVIIVIGELLIFGTIPVLGKAGFLDLKNKMKALFKRKPVEELRPVSRWRHVLGLLLALVVPLLLQATATVFGYSSFTAVTPEQPFPKIWGMTFEEQKTFFLTLMIGAEICIVAGFILLGGLWWEKFRQLYVWPGEELDSR